MRTTADKAPSPSQQTANQLFKQLQIHPTNPATRWYGTSSTKLGSYARKASKYTSYGYQGIADDSLAKEAIGPEEQHIFRRSLAAQKKQNQDRMLQEWQKEWQSSEKGKHLRRIAGGLPSKHTQKLYGPRQRNRAYLLAQLRTGHSWLASHTRTLRFSVEDKRTCGARETVIHVLVDCPSLRELRQELRSKIGDAFNNIAVMLGAKPMAARRESSGR